jgi:putative hydrolase of the HAD superfamily
LDRIVLFDFADTLAELSPGREQVVAELVAEQSGLRLGLARVAQAYRYLDALQPYSSVAIVDSAAREAFYAAYNQRLLTLLGVAHCVDSATLYPAFQKRRPHWQPKVGALSLLQALSAQGHRLGLASNFDNVLEQLLERLQMRSYFEVVVISQQLGCEKPDPAFYRSALSALRSAPGDCLYVGDSYSLDYLPARQLGVQAYLLDEHGLYPHLPHRLQSLNDVEKIVSGV